MGLQRCAVVLKVRARRGGALSGTYPYAALIATMPISYYVGGNTGRFGRTPLPCAGRHGQGLLRS